MDRNDTQEALTDLCRLAERHNALKVRSFTVIYHSLFAAWRERPLRLLEIGVWQGGSLLMWRDYFPNATLLAIDIEPSTLQWSERLRDCTVSLVDQGDARALGEYANANGPFDVVIEDGGHHMHQQITSFETIFPHVRAGGVYAMEDYGGSYLPEFGGRELNAAGTSVALLKQLIDSINLVDFMNAAPPDTVLPPDVAALRRDVFALQVYKNLAIIIKR